MNYLILLGYVLICEAAGGIGAIFTTRKIPTWYAGLIKPSFSPPNWLFGPVWTTLYALMGVSVWLVWGMGWSRPDVRFAVIFFFIHLAVNTAWSYLFFGLQSPILGLVGIIAIWLMIVVLMVLFYRIKPLAAYLLIPYFLWVSFATALNFEIWRLN